MTKNVHRSTTFLKVSKHKKYKTNLMFLVTLNYILSDAKD